MRRLASLICGLSCIALVNGCDWTSGGGVDDYNSRYNWVNFSGVYRGVNGGLLVTDYTATPGTPGVTNTVNGENIATANASSTTYNGVLRNKPVVHGSLAITAGPLVFTETEIGSGVLSAGSGTSGVINYSTGSWSINTGGLLAFGTRITANYQFTVAGNAGSGSAGSGSTRIRIFSFTVFHEGETFTITDNNGSVYTGRMGSIRSTGGTGTDSTSSSLSVGEVVIGQFNAKGTSAAGLAVEMVGTFQGIVGSADNINFYLNNRQMFGTWIEPQGRTGDINGNSSPIQIPVTGSGTDTTTETL